MRVPKPKEILCLRPGGQALPSAEQDIECMFMICIHRIEWNTKKNARRIEMNNAAPLDSHSDISPKTARFHGL